MPGSETTTDATALALPLSDLGAGEVERWRRLGGEALEPNPFFEPGFVLPAATGLGADGISLLILRRGDRWLGCLPLRRARGWHRVPLSGTLSWRTPYSCLGTPLLAADAGEEGMTALLSAVLELRRSSFVGLDLIGRDGPVAELLRRAAVSLDLELMTYRGFERAALHRRDDGDYLKMKSKHRRELRRLRDRLQEEVGAEVETIDRAADPAAPDDFLRLEQSGWKGKTGTAMGQAEGDARFFRGMCTNFAAEGRLQLLTLQAGDRPLAMKCNLIAGETVFCLKIAFDDELARFSPGIQLELDNIRCFAAEGRFSFMDSCAEPHNAMINRLWPDRRAIENLAIPSGRPVGRVAAPVLRLASRARQRVGETR